MDSMHHLNEIPYQYSGLLSASTQCDSPAMGSIAFPHNDWLSHPSGYDSLYGALTVFDL